VLGCKSCAHPEACARLLETAEAGPAPQAQPAAVPQAQPAAAPQALPTPDAPWFCRNADVFDALRWV
jgi:hypothetical protein